MLRIHEFAFCVLLATAATAGRPVWADDQTTRSLAANCTGCHGPEGRSSGAIPSLAGLEKSSMLKSLQEFKSGARPATVMHQHAKGYSDAEFEVLADHFSKLPRP